MSPSQYLVASPWLVWLTVLWTMPWKGVALWKAARRGEKIWFVILFVFNTLAILEIIYIFWGQKINVAIAKLRRPMQKPDEPPAAPRA